MVQIRAGFLKDISQLDIGMCHADAAKPCPNRARARAKPTARTTKEQRMDTCKQTTTTNQQPTVAATGTETPPSTKAKSTYDQDTSSAVIPIDKTCYASEDGQFRIEQLVQKTAKFPPSPYPVIVLQFFPQDHTRIRRLEGGGIEAMLTGLEIEQFVDAYDEAARASGKGKVFEVLQRVPEKTREHKKRWKKWNEERLGLRPKPGKWWPKQYNKHGKN